MMLQSIHRACPTTSWFLVGVALPYLRAATTSAPLRDYHWQRWTDLPYAVYNRLWIEQVYCVYHAESFAAKNVTTFFYAHKPMGFVMYCVAMAVVFNVGWAVVVLMWKGVVSLCTWLQRSKRRREKRKRKRKRKRGKRPRY